MRTTGWQGDLPQGEGEARQRIVDAARRCIERIGPTKTSLAAVATELGVTRQTVYRYYPGVNELLLAVAEAGAEDFLDDMSADLSFVTTPSEAATETILYCLRELPNAPYLGLLIRAGEAELFTRGATSSHAVLLGAQMLRRLNVDWEHWGIGDHELACLAEFVMRLFLSFLQHPPVTVGNDEELRTFLRTWIAADRVGTTAVRSP